MTARRVIRIRLEPVTANVASLGTLALSIAAFVTLAGNLPGYEFFTGLDILYFLACLPLLVAIHEGVHAAAGMYFGKLPLKAFTFGIIWRGLMPYCHCKEPLSVRAYRYGALMPLVVTVPAFVGLLYLHPAGWTAILTAFSLSGCVGDLLIIQKLGAFKANDLVQDCPDEAGCDVIVNEEKPAAWDLSCRRMNKSSQD